MNSNPVFEKVIGSAQLISLPEIYLKLRALMDDPDYTMVEVALLVGRDPGMATRFLQVVNSPLNRRAARIETVSHAVTLLGIRQIHDIVLSASVAKAFEGLETEVMDMKKFWERSVYCAVLTKQLARECELMENDRFMVIGLLHDIGHLFMYLSIPGESETAIRVAAQLERPLYQVERELLGFDYAEVGSHVMREWNLPESLQTTTRLHPEPVISEHFALETSLLHIACQLVHADMERGVFGTGAHVAAPAALELTGLTDERCYQAREVASKEYQAVAETIFPLHAE